MPKEKSYTLRDHRKRALLDGPRAAEKLDVHPNTIYGWELARCRPNPAQIRRLARLYQISSEQVVASLPKKRVGSVPQAKA